MWARCAYASFHGSPLERRRQHRVVAVLLAVPILGSLAASVPSVHESRPARATSAEVPAAHFDNQATQTLTGSAPVGETAYPVPPHAIFVSPQGSDAATGAVHAPLRTIQTAVSMAQSGGTIVLRAGVYHQSVSIWNKKLTVQNYPHEATWLDGSATVKGWVASGQHWVKTGWAHRFDHSPTYSRGRPDGRPPYRQWVNPAYPMAAHPDQVWFDRTALRQVASLDRVTTGTFYVDDLRHRLYVGSDPSGQIVRASTIARAMTVHGAGSIIRGLGLRRFAPSVPNMGAITLEEPSITVENVTIADIATTGLFVDSDNITLRNLDVYRSGLQGIGANGAYGLRLIRVDSSDNNVEHFNYAPVSGGVKITRSRGVLIKDGQFDHNNGPGLWLDESSYGCAIVGNQIAENRRHGVSLEISAKCIVADNLFVGNRGDNLKVNNTSDVKIWNNTFVGGGRALDLVQDTRVPTMSDGRNGRRPFPDPTMTWVLGPVSASNNVIRSDQNSTNCMLCVEDYSHSRAAEDFGIHANGNVYQRLHRQPAWVAVWSRGPGDPAVAVYGTLSQFHRATGQEAAGRLFDRSETVDSDGDPSPGLRAAQASIAQPIPLGLATAVRKAPGTRHLGAWRR